MKQYFHSLGALCLCAALLVIPDNAFGWGKKGHDVTCAIAREHLTAKAQKKINEILDGQSIVYWANWMDNASHTDEYAYTKTWHYKNIDANESYDNAAINPSGDVVTAIEAQIKALKSGELNKDAQAIALRMLVHLVGDLHCPMHMGHKSDSGGNGWQIQYFNSSKNLHSIWDSGVIEDAHNWTYSEWVKEIDIISKDEAKKIAEGTPYEWGRETFGIATKIYDGTPKGSKLSYDYVSEWGPVVEQQVLKGGYRLARILNEIFK